MSQKTPELDVVIIGAGVCGIYLLYRMQQLGFKTKVLERGGGPGGTWYWNRYPGARFDSESYSYGYSFSDELLQEWDWSEHFAAQPETLSYLNYVIDKFQLRDDMNFDCEVKRATFDESSKTWTVELQDGRSYCSRFILTAVGMLSAPTPPHIPGLEKFKGESFHTYYWPQQPVELKGKRVAVIGTGATGVQVISEIADKVEHLTVFQRRPNWCAPLNNSLIDAETQSRIKQSYDKIFARCNETPGAFLHGPDRRELAEVPREERLQFWEWLYQQPGFGVWLGNYRDVLTNAEANAEYSDFIAGKIRERVSDPDVAELLIPKDHGFGSRRVPMETRYYEAYNRNNVRLVDLNKTPIESISENGICTSAEEIPVDLIIFATGFDAITGSFDRMEIEGRGGQTLRDKWTDGPVTYLGLQASGFPNLLTLAGPQGASVSTNFPRGIEDAVDWATDLLAHMKAQGYDTVEADAVAEQEWTEHVKSTYVGMIASTTNSWFTGYNSNVEGHGKDKIRHVVYFGGAPKYRETLQDVARDNYRGLKFQ